MARVGAPRIRREKLLAKLGRIIENIERNPIFMKEVKPGSTIISRLFAGILQFRVKRLWVVGSFAHGARECGDLDLVVETELVGGSPNDTRNITICVRNGETHVDVLVGTPEANHTGMEFQGAILIWTSDDRDWQTKVSAIPVQDGDIRLPRKTDRLPISHKLLGLSLEDAENLVEKLATGHYQWDLVPYDTLTLSSERWPEDLRRQLHRSSSGKESRVSRDYSLEYILQQRPIPTDNLRGRARHWTLCGSEVFCVPTPEFSLTTLDTSYTCTQVVVAPPKRTGSALWVLRRSAAHPLAAQQHKRRSPKTGR